MQREGTAGDEANPERKRRRRRGFDDLPAPTELAAVIAQPLFQNAIATAGVHTLTPPAPAFDPAQIAATVAAKINATAMQIQTQHAMQELIKMHRPVSGSQ